MPAPCSHTPSRRLREVPDQSKHSRLTGSSATAGRAFSLVSMPAASTRPSSVASLRSGRLASSICTSSAAAMTRVTSGSMMPMPSWTTKNGSTTHSAAADRPAAVPSSRRASRPTAPAVRSPAPIETMRTASSGLKPTSIHGMASQNMSGSRAIEYELNSPSSDREPS